jgi:hypothetical protein
MNKSVIQDISDKLFWEVLWVNGKWQIYNQIFIDENSKSILFQSGYYPIFKVFLNSLAIDIYMMINRLLDPHSSTGKKNICFDTLILEVNKINDQIAEKMSDKLETIRKDSEGLKVLRNTTIAHTDFNMHINLDDISPLKPNIKEVNNILDGISDLLNIFIREIEKRPPLAFSKFKMSQDGYDIINLLEKNVAH